MEWSKDSFTVSTDKRLLDLEVIHGFLKTSYWAADRSREDIARTMEASICFGVYEETQQIGFARIVTDYVAHSWLGDVFIVPESQGRGLGKWLMTCVVSHPVLKQTSCDLGTRDAHGLYEQFAFERVERMVRPKSGADEDLGN